MLLEKAMQADRSNGGMQFDVAKAIAAISYLASRTGETMYPVLKMLYVADKCHLEQYGRFIVGDTYVAMPKGPVPSKTYDLLKFVRGDRKFFDRGDEAVRAFDLDTKTHRFVVHGEADLRALSESDVECLDSVVDVWRKRGSNFIRDESHDDAWRATGKNASMSIEAIAAQFGPAVVQHLMNRHPG
jgi:uncharacterized phage-associated protein